MKRVIFIVTIMILATLSSVATDKSFYFIGKATKNGVYLRWDAIEGNFPKDSDIEQIVLSRDDINISTFNPNEIMDEKQIKELYALPENEKSLKSIISSISKNDDSICSGANLGNYASKIRLCMQNNMWRYLTSKVDFNIARVGYRAYLDKTPLTHSVTYKLIAIKHNNSQIVETRLGKIEIDPSKTTSILGAKNFKQVRQSLACNAPEYAKDDYTVALSWENGGSKTDAFANSMMIAGYDLYRVKGSEEEYSTSNLATLVNSATVDDSGNYVFAGLEKVNDVPLLLANSQGEEKALFLETKEQLKKAGLKAGDSRWYYLVVRDFTGGYGATAKLKVTIPDLLAPVTPWGVRAIEHNKKVKLIWQNVNIPNYIEYYKNSKKFCNIGTLSTNERLHFVEKGGTCGINEMEANLNVDKYYIYRFDNSAEASKFQDSDLDGIGDLDDSEVCKTSSQKLNPPLVKIINANDFRGQKFITFVDNDVNKSKYYWYRIVSVRGQIGSIMTPPIRTMVPDRTLPKKIEVELKACSNAYVIEVVNKSTRYFAQDKTGLAKYLKIIQENRQKYIPIDNDGFANFPNWINTKLPLTIEFIDKKIDILASKKIGAGKSINRLFILNDCNAERGLEKVYDGEDIYSFPIINLKEPIKENECLEITQTINGKRYKKATICDKVDKIDTKELNISNMGKGEKFCLGINMINANNQYSPTTYSPCFGVVDQGKPDRPDMRKIKINGDNNITVSWVSSFEKIASTIVSIYNADDTNKSYLRSFPQPDHMNSVTMDKLLISKDIDIDTTQSQNWCAKVKSVGFNGKTSPWSSQKCTQDEIEENHKNLAWPKIDSVEESVEKVIFSYSYDPKFINNSLTTVIAEGEFTCVQDKSLDKQIEEKLQYLPLNFIFYRQSRQNNTWSDYIQVSPLIYKIKVVEKLSREIESYKPIHEVYRLEDNLRVHAYHYGCSPKNRHVIWHLIYNDNYPFRAGETYRYVKVNFDKNHEIKNYTVSNEVTTTQGDE